MKDLEEIVEKLRLERVERQLTLGELLTEIQDLPPDMPVLLDYGDAAVTTGREHSYRGYYSDLSFEPLTLAGKNPTPVRVLLEQVRTALGGRVYRGYKGGDFVMRPDTTLWIASYGTTGRTVVGTARLGDALILKTGEED